MRVLDELVLGLWSQKKKEPEKVVSVDGTIRGRDNATAVFLSRIHEGYSEGSQMLMRGERKDITYAEYAKVPLET